MDGTGHPRGRRLWPTARTRKSPPIDAATRPLWEAQIRANREYEQRMSDYEEALDEYDDVVRQCEEQGRRPPLRPMEPIAVERFLVGEVGVERKGGGFLLSRVPAARSDRLPR